MDIKARAGNLNILKYGSCGKAKTKSATHGETTYFFIKEGLNMIIVYNTENHRLFLEEDDYIPKENEVLRCTLSDEANAEIILKLMGLKK